MPGNGGGLQPGSVKSGGTYAWKLGGLEPGNKVAEQPGIVKTKWHICLETGVAYSLEA
jgi:hypothetical protein